MTKGVYKLSNAIYLDNASTTPLCEAAKQVMLENIDNYYNTANVYEPARQMRCKVEAARERIAELIGAESANEIYFTSGGSEANSWALHNKFSLVSNIEHSSVCGNMTFPVASNGIVNVAQFESALASYVGVFCPHIDVVSLMSANNEIGTIQPISDIAHIAHKHGVLFHSDMVQLLPHMKVNIKDIGVDMASASAHKFNGPKGVGFLYVKNGVNIDPMIYGGTQERNKRGGTTNALGVLAMAAALDDTLQHLDETNAKIIELQYKLESCLLDIKGVATNGSCAKTQRIQGISNFRIDGVRGADVVAMASQYGIYLSAGSACHEGDALPSHVLTAIGLTDEQALSSIRISVGRHNTENDINRVCDVLPAIIRMLRNTR